MNESSASPAMPNDIGPLSASFYISRSTTIPAFLDNTVQGITSNTTQQMNSSHDSVKTCLIYLSDALNPLRKKKPDPSSYSPSLTSTIITPMTFRMAPKNKEDHENKAINPTITYHEKIIDLWQDLKQHKFWKRRLRSSPHSHECAVPIRAGRSSCSNRQTISATNGSKTSSVDDFEISYVYVYKKKTRKQQQMKMDKPCLKDNMRFESTNVTPCNNSGRMEGDYLTTLAFLTNIHTPIKEQGETHSDATQEITPLIIQEYRNLEARNEESHVSDEFSSLLEVYFGLEENK